MKKRRKRVLVGESVKERNDDDITLWTSNTGIREFREPPAAALPYFTKLSLTQWYCKICGVEIHDTKLATHWRWHKRLQNGLYWSTVDGSHLDS